MRTAHIRKPIEMPTNAEIIAGYLRRLADECREGANDLRHDGHSDSATNADERARMIDRLAVAVEHGLIDTLGDMT